MKDIQSEKEFTIKDYFFPLTINKAIHFIILIGFFTYGNSLFNGFVGDDNGQILNNPLVHSLTNIPEFFRGSTLYLQEVGQHAGLYYRPLLSLSFAVLYSFFGATAFPFHLFQLILHIANAILIFLLFRKHIRLSIAFGLSLLFLLHPINNEAVVYISNLQEQLFSFFGLLALHSIAYKKAFYVTPVFLFLSLLGKETGIVFLPLTILYYFLFHKHLNTKRTFLIVLSVVSVLVLYIFVRIVVGNTGFTTEFLYMSVNATVIERMYTIPSVITYYLRIIFFPVTLAFGWYWVIKEPSFANFIIPLVFSVIEFILLLVPMRFIREKNYLRIYIFFLLFFLSNILLILQFFPLDLTVADRWFYMPSVGLFGIAGVLYEVFERKLLTSQKKKTLVIVLFIMLITFYALRDGIRNTNWFDNVTLCSHDVENNPTSYILEFCLSNELYNSGEYKNAKIHAQNAVALYPEYFLSWYTLGKIYYASDERDKALESFKESLKYNDFALGSEEIALIYVYKKNTKEARRVTTTYLPKLPHSAQLWYAVALTSYLEKNYEEATAAAKKAYQLDPTPLTEKVYYRLENNLPIRF